MPTPGFNLLQQAYGGQQIADLFARWQPPPISQALDPVAQPQPSPAAQPTQPNAPVPTAQPPAGVDPALLAEAARLFFPITPPDYRGNPDMLRTQLSRFGAQTGRISARDRPLSDWTLEDLLIALFGGGGGGGGVGGGGGGRGQGQAQAQAPGLSPYQGPAPGQPGLYPYMGG